MTRVLILDSDLSRRSEYQTQMERLHLSVIAVERSEEAVELLKKQHFHLCLWSLNAPEDTQKLFAAKQVKPGTAFIALSDLSHSSHVVECMRMGASNFWTRTQTTQGLTTVVSETLSRVLPEEVTAEDVDFPFPDFVGRHPKILEIFQLILSIRNTDSTVLITGESGTGKEVVARAIHQLSPRRKHPWIAVNCSAIPINLLESELFGHVKGAFTGATQNRPGRFQIAGQGTLFLDEISDLPLDLQAKILRAIQHRVYEPVGSTHSMKLEARIIAATNQDLEVAVSERRFREDLFYRLNVIPIMIPPLRSRRTDIPLLARAFLERFNEVNSKQIAGISEEAMQCLMQYHWPGNVRELENLMERVVVLKKNNQIIEAKDFPVEHFRNVRLDRFVANVVLPEDGLDFNQAVDQFENELILQALQRTDGNRNQAATLLNLNRTTLVEKLKRKGLRVI